MQGEIETHQLREEIERLRSRVAILEQAAEWKQRFEFIAAAGNQAIYERDLATGNMVWSSSVEQVLGYSPAEMASTLEAWQTLIHTDDLVKVQQLIAGIAENQGSYVIVYRFRHKAGHYLWVEDRGYCLPDRSAYQGTPRLIGLIANVTGRKQVEAQRANIEERYRMLSEMISDFAYFLRFDPDGQVVRDWGVGAYDRITGYTVEERNAAGGWTFPVHPQDLPTVRHLYERLIEGGEPSEDVIYRIIPKQGGIRWLQASTRLVWDDHKQKVIGVLGAGRDITERKLAEDTLKESEWKLRVLYDNASVGIVLSSRQRQFAFANPAFCRMVNYTAEEIIAGDVRLTHPDDWKKEQALFDRVENKEIDSYQLEKRYFTKEGKVIWVQVHRSCYRNDNGEVRFFIGIVEDITERKFAEEALKESEWKLRSIYEHASVGLVLTSPDLRIIFTNPAFCKITGYSAEELLSEYILLTHPDDRDKEAPLLEQIDRGEINSFQLEKRYITKAGEVIWVQVHRSSYRDDAGVLRFYIAIVEDITERKRIQEQLLTSLKDKEILLKEVHHRVKNNMQVISSLLRLQAANIADPVIQEYLLESQLRVRSMALVHEKLYQSASLAQINMAEYVRELSAILFQSYGTRQSRIELQIDIEPITMAVDTAISCGLIINELVSNALKHAFPSLPSFPSEISGKVSIGLKASGHQRVKLTVSDTGVGLPPGFDSRKTKTLGMQLIHSLCRQIGATLDISTNAPGTQITAEFQGGGLS